MKKQYGKKAIIMAMLAMGVMGLLTGCGGEKKESAQNKKPVVGVLQLVQHTALDDANKGFVDGLASKGYKAGENIEYDQQNAQGDQSNLKTISQRFVNKKVNLIHAISLPAAQIVANETKDIPIVGSTIVDYEKSKLVKDPNKPGTNVTGTSIFLHPKNQIELMKKVLPNAKRVGILYTSSEANAQFQVGIAKKYLADNGYSIEEVTISNVNDIQQAAQNLVSQHVDAIYVPTDNVVASAMSNLVAITDPAKIPVFGGEDNHVKGGAVMSLSVDYYKLGYQTGLMAAKILTGEAKVEDMPIEMQKEFKLVVGKDKLEKLGITLPEDLMNKASMI